MEKPVEQSVQFVVTQLHIGGIEVSFNSSGL